MEIKRSYSLRLRGEDILKLAPEEVTAYAVSKNSGVTHNTVYGYLTARADNVKRIELSAFADAMIKGLGLSPEEFLKLPLSEFFKLEVKGK